MPFSPDTFRRWLGAFFLTVAVGMLVLGQTVWESKLKEFHFVLYWIICFIFTGLAAVTALWDAMMVSRQSLDLQRKLINETLNEAKEKAEQQRARANMSAQQLSEPK